MEATCKVERSLHVKENNLLYVVVTCGSFFFF